MFPQTTQRCRLKFRTRHSFSNSSGPHIVSQWPQKTKRFWTKQADCSSNFKHNYVSCYSAIPQIHQQCIPNTSYSCSSQQRGTARIPGVISQHFPSCFLSLLWVSLTMVEAELASEVTSAVTLQPYRSPCSPFPGWPPVLCSNVSPRTGSSWSLCLQSWPAQNPESSTCSQILLQYY